MQCSNCQRELESDTKFCPQCGTPVREEAELPVIVDVPTQCCNRCGTMITKTALYCPNCGNYCGKGIPSGNRGSSERENTLMELDKMYKWFSQKANVYKRYDKLNEEISPKINRVGKKAMLIWGCIVSSIAFFILLIGFYMWSYTRSLGGIVFGLLTLLVGTGLIVGFIALEAARRKKVPMIQEEMERCARELTEHYRRYGYCEIGPEYTNPEIIREIQAVVSMGRAYTIKEALNVMINDLRMDEMRELSQITAENAARAARGAKTAAVFAAANFFFKR